jgi:phosphopantetheinyl transferase
VLTWLASLEKPSLLPAAWSLDTEEPALRKGALALTPTPEDLARAARRPSDEREAVLVRRGLVRLCVAAALDVPAADVAILWSQRGAPLLAPFGDHRLSWAQRGNRFACAMARQPIGVDVEISDGGEIPWNVLHADEVRALRATPPTERDTLFSRIWAAKEAYGKALGEGLRRESTEFSVSFLDPHEGFISDPASSRRDAARIFLKATKDSAIIAVALTEA